MSFKGLHGTRRVLAEYTTLHKQIEDGQSPHLSDLTLVGDNIHTWRLKVKNFDEDTPGGAALNADLQKLNEKYRQDHLLLEATFPEDYPTEPFFLRVIAPRCVWYTGHVTAGGSICIESLTQSGTPGSWDPNFSFEAIMNVVTTNMIDCETVEVRTRTGPGGLSGPLRIDLSHRYCGNVMSPYSMMEAKSAFQRTLRHHSQVGWGGENASNPDPPRGAKRPSRSRTAEKGKASKKSSEKDEGKKPLLPPTTPAQPSLMNPLPSLTPPGSSGALGLAVNSGHQSGVDLTTSVGSWLKSLTHRSGSGSASGSGPGSGPGSGSGSRSKQVPAWVSAKPKPLKKLSQSPVAPQVTSAADDGIFDEVILMLEKEGEKEKQEKMRKAAKKEAKRRRAERGTGDLASSSALGKKAEGSSVVETVDLLGSPLPERTEQKLPLTPGSEGVDLMAAFEKEKRKMEEQWEEERRLREAELAEMERQVRLAKEKSKLVCSPPPNWFSQVEGRNLMVVELPFQPVQHASKRKKRGEKSSPGGSDTPAETDADVLMISEMLQNAGYLERATKVFRVQNTKLWTKYNLWKRDIREEVGKSHLNERHLWHGADMETIGKIINEGFDARVSHLSGSLGGGIYFSESMEYSEGYSRMPAHSVGPANVGKPKPKHRRSGKRKMVENLDDFFYTTFSTSVDPVTQMPIPEAYEMGMLLSRVVLGKSCPSSGLVNNGTLRKAPDGYHSVSHKMHPNLPIHAIYDNPQAYPEFLIFFR